MSLHESCSEDDVDGDYYFSPNVACNNGILLVQERLVSDATTPKGGGTIKQQQGQQRQHLRHDGSFQVPVERLSMWSDSNRSVSPIEEVHYSVHPLVTTQSFVQFAPLFDEFTDTDRLSDPKWGRGGGFDSPSIESLTLNPLPADMDSFTSCYTSTSSEDIGISPPQQQVRSACPKDKAAFSAIPNRSVNVLAAESMISTLRGNVATTGHRKADDASRSPSQFAEGESIFSEDLIATEFVPDDDSETLPGILERRLPVSKESDSDDMPTGFLSHASGGCFSCSDLHDQQEMMQLWHASKTKAKALLKNVMHVLVVLFERDDETERGGHTGAPSYSYDYSETPVTEVSRYTYTSSEGDEDSYEFDDNDNEEEDDDYGERSCASRSNRSGFGRRDEAHSEASISEGNASVPSNRPTPIKRAPKALLGTDPLRKVNDGVKKLFGDGTDTFSRKQSQQFDRATDRFAC